MRRPTDGVIGKPHQCETAVDAAPKSSGRRHRSARSVVDVPVARTVRQTTGCSEVLEAVPRCTTRIAPSRATRPKTSTACGVRRSVADGADGADGASGWTGCVTGTPPAPSPTGCRILLADVAGPTLPPPHPPISVPRTFSAFSLSYRSALHLLPTAPSPSSAPVGSMTTMSPVSPPRSSIHKAVRTAQRNCATASQRRARLCRSERSLGETGFGETARSYTRHTTHSTQCALTHSATSTPSLCNAAAPQLRTTAPASVAHREVCRYGPAEPVAGGGSWPQTAIEPDTPQPWQLCLLSRSACCLEPAGRTTSLKTLRLSTRAVQACCEQAETWVHQRMHRTQRVP